MKNTYVLNGGVKLHTYAARRFLIASVMDGRAHVEASTDDEDAAAKLVARYRREFAPAPRCTIELIDQAQR